MGVNMFNKNYIKIIISLIALLAIVPTSAQTSRNIRALFILPNEFGANTNLNKDNFENLGWDLTYAATTKTVDPCPWAERTGVEPFTVDSLVGEIKSAMAYDCLIITSGSASSIMGDPCRDLMDSKDMTRLINEAVEGGIVVSAYCTAVRVLANADVLNGKNVTGQQLFISEYTAAGANYMGSKSVPVIDGNIVTSVRGDYYYIQNSDATADAVEQNGLNPAITKKASPVHSYNNYFVNEDIIWTKTLGDEASELCEDIFELGDGNIVLIGATYSEGAGSVDMLIKKVDASGNELWSTVIGGENREFGNSITVLNNYIYAAGITTSVGSGKKDYYLVKLDMDGNEIWTKTFGGNENDICRKIITTSSNELIMCGETFSSGEGEDDLMLIKVDENGNQLGQKVYGYLESDMAFDIIQTVDGGFLITGASGHFSDKRDLWLIKMDQAWNITWDKNYGVNDDNDWGFKVLEYASNYYVYGKSDKHGQDFYTAAIAKMDLDGNLIYLNKYGEDDLYEFGRDFVVHDSLITLAGIKKTYEYSNDLFILTISLDGDLQEENIRSNIQLTNEGNDWVNAILFTQDQNYLIAGQTNSLGGGTFDIFLMKLNSLMPDFDADRRTGHAPLEINFTNSSYGPTFTSQWDFDNDGTFDANSNDASFIFSEPGTYSTKLEVATGLFTKEIVKENFIKVFDGESCLGFPSSQSRIEYPANFLPDLTQAFTIEMWLNTASLATGRTIFDKGSILFETVGNSLFYDNCYFMKLAFDDGTTVTATTPDSSLAINTWQHVCVAHSSDNAWHIYINGIDQELSVRGGDISKAIASNVDKNFMFGNNQSYSKSYDGLMDEIRIWNYNRTSNQIFSDFRTYLTGSENNLLLYLNLNEGWGNTTTNLVNSSYSAELNNPDWNQSLDITTIVGVEDDKENLKYSFVLEQNYPNPFNPITKINYQIASAGHVNLIIYDVLGEIVKVLVDEEKTVGNYSVDFKASNLASGIYFYQIKTKDYVCTKKMMLLK